MVIVKPRGLDRVSITRTPDSTASSAGTCPHCPCSNTTSVRQSSISPSPFSSFSICPVFAKSPNKHVTNIPWSLISNPSAADFSNPSAQAPNTCVIGHDYQNPHTTVRRRRNVNPDRPADSRTPGSLIPLSLFSNSLHTSLPRPNNFHPVSHHTFDAHPPR
ncbi:hypothetical protein BC567DRAFT_37352 [Phyllosticta citribraziliensis]